MVRHRVQSVTGPIVETRYVGGRVSRVSNEAGDAGPRRLQEQLPESGYPGGVSAASWSLLVALMVVSVLTVIMLDGRTDEQASQAYLDVQRDLVVDAARSVGTAADQNLADLRMAVAGTANDSPDAVLDRLGADREWHGLAVVSAADRALLATRGEVVPTERLPVVDGSALAVTASATGQALMLSVITLPGGDLLAATSAIRLPATATATGEGRPLLLVTGAGKIITNSTNSATAYDKELADLVAGAGRRSLTAEPGDLLGAVAGGRQPAVAYAAVVPDEHEDLGVAVISASYAPTTGPNPGGAGIPAAAALAVAAIAGFLLVRLTLVRPVRRLRADALAVASGALHTEVRTGGPMAVNRIAAALRACQRTLLRTKSEDPARRRSPPAATGLTVATVAVLGWSGAVATYFTSQDVSVPPEVVATMRDQAAGASDAVRRSLNEGVADLSAVAEADRTMLAESMRELVDTEPRYRSVYLVDAAGRASATAGREPLRAEAPVPAAAGLRQQDGAGRVPVIFAHVPLADGRVLVGEFDLDHLATLLSRAPGDARIVDREFRTVSATFGYVAFETVADGDLRRAVDEARAGAVVAAVARPDGTPAVVSGAPLTGGAATELGWTLVAERPIADLALPANLQGRNAQLVALIAGLLAFFAFGWQLVTVVRPLGRVATAADRLVAGNRTDHIVAQRHDEIGTIAGCLELCRQALNDGPARLGSVRRPQGAATEQTMLIAAATQLFAPVRRPPRPPAKRREHGAKPAARHGSR
jgi:HAMP domain-containing protein